MRRRFTAALGALSLFAVPLQAPALGDDDASVVDLVLRHGQDRATLRLVVHLGSRDAAEHWRQAFAQVFDYFDRDGDGALSSAESARLPTPFELRQILWRPAALPSGRAGAVEWIDLDADQSDSISLDELAAYYRAHGLGRVVVGVGAAPHTAPLGARLVALLDHDRDGVLAASELRDAERLLDRVDMNRDELANAAELVDGADYPGTAGTRRLTPLELPLARAEDAGFPIVIAPRADGDACHDRWVKQCDRNRDGAVDCAESGLPREWFALLDRNADEQLDATELTAFATESPDHVARIRLPGPDDASAASVAIDGQPDGESPRDHAEVHARGLEVSVAAIESDFNARLDAAVVRLTAQFADADTNQDGAIDETEATGPSQYELRGAFAFSDRDGNRRLDRGELAAWLAIHRRVGQCQTLATALDLGAGLFEQIDANRDGALSRRELRTTAERMDRAGLLDNDQLALDRLPRRICVAVGRGHPRGAWLQRARRGPEWFVAMDRNRDGDLSTAEFPADGDSFARLDDDRDGLISADEAMRVRAERPTVGR